jgi:hypothetical protein
MPWDIVFLDCVTNNLLAGAITIHVRPRGYQPPPLKMLTGRIKDKW